MVKNFPLVCVAGATAEIGVFTKLLEKLPGDMGVAVVVINRIKAVANLLIAELPGCTDMPVELITDGLEVQPNRLYFLQYGHDLHILDGEFRLKPVSKPTGWTDVTTVFLGSATNHWRGRLIAVILSGRDGDGAPALRGVKEAGGMTIAQKADTAREPDMPLSAIATGYVDFILSVEDIATEIARIACAAEVG